LNLVREYRAAETESFTLKRKEKNDKHGNNSLRKKYFSIELLTYHKNYSKIQ
jgi:hypothetical protein